MDLVFQETRGFLADLKKLSEDERRRVAERINDRGQKALTDWRAFRRGLLQPTTFDLRYGIKSSLFVLKVGHDLCVVFAVDEDRIFDQMLVSLYRVVRREEIAQVYERVGRLLYEPEGLLRDHTPGHTPTHQAVARRIRRDSRGR